MQRILIAIPLVGLTALGLWLSTAKAHRVTRANFDRIKQGMSREQVDALLGEDLVRWSNFDTMTGWRWDAVLYSDEDLHSLRPANTIDVRFENDKVIFKDFYPWTVADLVWRLRERLSL
jgi:hypothetical protein